MTHKTQTPLLWALVPLAGGIVFGAHFFVPWWIVGGGLAVCGAVAWWQKSQWMILVMLFLFGIGSYNLRHDVLEQRVEELRTPPSNGVHEWAVERLNKLGLEKDAQATVNAMVAGERSGISYELRQAYSRSGTSHLLAVSGLHVGIVFMLANFVLRWLLVVKRGHVWRNLSVIVLIWVYAAVAGFPPSVIRAAFMFTLLQFSLASSSAYASLNTLAAAAVVMLVVNPLYLFSLSFQLSFIAVGGIVLWGVPVARWLHGPWAISNALVGIACVGFAATAATAPLIMHTFGQISVIGPVLNPVVILLANGIVGLGAVWMLLPFIPGLPRVLGGIAGTQNGLIEWAAGLPRAAVEVRMTEAWCWAAYGTMILVTYGVRKMAARRF